MEKALSRQRILLQHLQPTSYSGASSQAQESANISVRPKSRSLLPDCPVLLNLSQFNGTFSVARDIKKGFPLKGCFYLWIFDPDSS